MHIFVHSFFCRSLFKVDRNAVFTTRNLGYFTIQKISKIQMRHLILQNVLEMPIYVWVIMFIAQIPGFDSIKRIKG